MTPQDLAALAVKARRDNHLILASIGGQEVFTDIQKSELMGRVSVLAVDGRSKDAARARSANSGRCSQQANNPAPIYRVILDHTGPSRPVHPMERKHGKQTCSMGGNPGRPTVDKNGSARRLAMPKTKVAGGLRVDRIARVAPGPLRPRFNSDPMGSPTEPGASVQDHHNMLCGVHRDDIGLGAGQRPVSGTPRPYTGLLADVPIRLGFTTKSCPRSVEPSGAAGASALAALVGGHRR